VIQAMVERAEKPWQLRAVLKPGSKSNSQTEGMGDRAVFRSYWPAALTVSQRRGN